MSTHTSSKTALESLQERLKSLHKRRYNLDANFISIRQHVGVMIDQHLDIRNLVYQRLLRRACNNYLRQYAAHMPYLPSLQASEFVLEIPTGRGYLEIIETRMSKRMKNLRDLREISLEIEEEIRKVEPEVMVGMADMLLEETRTLRNVGFFHRSTGGN